MKNFVKLFAAMRSIAIIALAAVIGFGITACGGSGPPGGGSGIILVEGIGSHGVAVYMSSDFENPVDDRNENNYQLTINETLVNIEGMGLFSDGMKYGNTILFSSPAIIEGNQYHVKVVYTGSAVAPFTREATVTAFDRFINTTYP